MDNLLNAQKRYFQVQLDRCRKRPALHKHKIADCEQYLKVLNDSGSLAAFAKYVEETGNMVSSARAEALDRCANRLFLYEKLGLRHRAGAEKLRFAAAEQAKAHRELGEGLTAAEEKAGALEHRESRAILAAVHVVRDLFHLATDPEGSDARKRSLAGFKEYLKQLKEADPEFSWSKLTTYPPYRDRISFSDSQLASLEKTYREVQHGSGR